MDKGGWEIQMSKQSDTLIDLENRFWRSLVSQDTDAALALLNEPALMVSSHGAIKFDHAGYRKMAEQGSMVLTSFELSDMQVVLPDDNTAVLTYRVKQQVSPRGQRTSTAQEMNDTSTWIRKDQRWQCVMHTETPVARAQE